MNTTSKSLPIIETKVENILVDDDTDCFSNHDKKEKPCQICGVAEECAEVTSLKFKTEETNNTVKNSINDVKELLSRKPKIKKLIKKLKNKEKSEFKKLRHKQGEVMVLKKKSEKSGKSEVSEKPSKSEKVPTTKVSDTKVKIAKPEKKEKSEKGRPAKPTVNLIEGTMFPVGFESLAKGLEKVGKVEHKTSVTKVAGENGILVSVTPLGRAQDKVALFLNKSRGWDPGTAKKVELGKWSNGEVKITTGTGKESTAEALEICNKWKADYDKHVAANGGKKGRPAGTVVKSEKKGVVIKKDKGDKPEVKGEKAEKKEAPAVKPAKKVVKEDKPAKPKVAPDDEEG